MTIKKNFIIGALFIGFNISFTGCSSEEIINEPPQQETQDPSDETQKPDPDNPESELPEGYVRMTFTSGNDNKQSRISVIEDSTKMGISRWDAGDIVTIMTGSNINNLKECKFSTEIGGVGSAFFEYIGEAVDTKTYFGIHNANYEMSDKQIRFIIPVGNGDEPLCQTKKNNSNHLNKYRPMYTDIQKRDENSNELTGLTFKHLSSLLIFNIKNGSGKDVNINSIKTKVLSDEQSYKPFYNKGVRLIANIEQTRSKVTYTSEEKINSDFILLNLGDNTGKGLTIEKDEIFQAYQSLLPVVFNESTNTKIQFMLNINGKEIESLTLDSDKVKEFAANKYYEIKLLIKPDETIDIIDIETGIEEWEDGGNIVIPID